MGLLEKVQECIAGKITCEAFLEWFNTNPNRIEELEEKGITNAVIRYTFDGDVDETAFRNMLQSVVDDCMTRVSMAKEGNANLENLDSFQPKPPSR